LGQQTLHSKTSTNDAARPSTTGTSKTLQQQGQQNPSTAKVDSTEINTHWRDSKEIDTHRSLNTVSGIQEEGPWHLYQVHGSFIQVWKPRRGVAAPLLMSVALLYRSSSQGRHHQ